MAQFKWEFCENDRFFKKKNLKNVFSLIQYIQNSIISICPWYKIDKEIVWINSLIVIVVKYIT